MIGAMPIQKGDYVTGLVTAVEPKFATIKLGPYHAMLTPADFAWTGHKSPADLLKAGDLVVVSVKEISGATARSSTRAAAGRPGRPGRHRQSDRGNQSHGRAATSFGESKFNRATQAMRQTGSSFKVYVYAEALDQGASPFDTVVDAPVSFHSGGLIYSPHNYDEKFEGRITLAPRPRRFAERSGGAAARQSRHRKCDQPGAEVRRQRVRCRHTFRWRWGRRIVVKPANRSNYNSVGDCDM